MNLFIPSILFIVTLTTLVWFWPLGLLMTYLLYRYLRLMAREHAEERARERSTADYKRHKAVISTWGVK